MRPHSAFQSKKKTVGVIWDLDGTIADTAKLALAATNAILIQHGIRDETTQVTHEEYAMGAMYTTPRRLAWHAVNEPDNPLGLQLGREFDEMYLEMVNPATVCLFPEMYGVIEEVYRDVTVVQAVLSNACGLYVRKVCSGLGIIDNMSSCVGADEVPAAKPRPEGLLQCSTAIRVAPEFCVYIGDSKTDGMAAKAAGMKSVYCAWLDTIDVEETASYFDYVVRSKAELLSIIHEVAIDFNVKNRGRKSHSKIVWDPDVEDNEHAHKMRTDNEYWDGRR
jgi:beta-phosphoglucomutase-like phosphatase (HAD superfamily)